MRSAYSIFRQLCGFLLITYVASSAAVTITRFSPPDAAAGQTQVSAAFSHPVVTFGDAQQPAPFDIQCPVKGESVWLNTQLWAYNFEKPLPPGVECQFTVRDDFKPINQQTFTGKKQFTIVTDGPTPVRTWPGRYGTVEEDQVFVLRLNGSVDTASLNRHAWCEIDGVQEKIPLQLVNESSAAQVVKYLFDNNPPEHLLFAKCARPLPPERQVAIVWGKGIAAEGNTKLTTREDIRFEYSVRNPLNVKINCERLHAQGNCLPIRPISVWFSEEISADTAKRITLKTAKGVRKPEALSEKNTNTVQFAAPFDPNSTAEIILPTDFKDISGRALSPTQQLPIQVTFGDIPPLAKFPGTFGILESNANPTLPVTLRNVESLKDTQTELRVQQLYLGADTDNIKIRNW